MKPTLKNGKVVILAVLTAFGLSCLMVGCEREVAHTESTKVSSDGTVKTKETSVKENPDGTLTKTEKKTTDKP